MKKLNLNQSGNFQSESSLMGLKCDGLHRKTNHVKSANLIGRRTSFNNEESLLRIKVNEYHSPNGVDVTSEIIRMHQYEKNTLRITLITMLMVLLYICSFAQTAITVSATSQNVSCNGGSDGGISLNVSGGLPPYIYMWSNGVTNQNNSNLAAGVYTTTVTDQNGNTSTASAMVSQPPNLIIIIDSIISVSYNGANDGKIYSSGSGGTTPYSYNWSNGATTSFLTGLAAGTYYATLTDTNGCTSTTSASVAINPTPPIIIWDSIAFSPIGNATLQLIQTFDSSYLKCNYLGNSTTETFGISGLVASSGLLSIDNVWIPMEYPCIYKMSFQNNTDSIINLNVDSSQISFTSNYLNYQNDSIEVYLNDSLVSKMLANSSALSGSFTQSIYSFDFSSDTAGSNPVRNFIAVTFHLPVNVTMPNQAGAIGDKIVFVFTDTNNYTVNKFSITQCSVEPIMHVEEVAVGPRTGPHLPVETFLVTGIDTSNIAPVTNSSTDPVVHVSPAMMDLLTVWSNLPDTSTLGLTDFLQNQNTVSQTEVSYFLTSFFDTWQPSSNCYCKAVLSDVNYGIVLVPDQLTDNGNNPYTNGDRWNAWYRTTRFGPAYRNYLSLTGHRRDWSISHPTEPAEAYSVINYICVNTVQQKSNCCNQEVEVHAKYNSNMSVNNYCNSKRNYESFSSAEDESVLFAYDLKNGSSVDILAFEKKGLANNAKQVYNTNFTTTLLNLATTVYSSVTSNNPYSASSISSIATSLNTVLATPIWYNYGTPGLHAETLNMHYDGTLTLQPNSPKVIRMLSVGYVRASGSGASDKNVWHAEAKIASDFMLNIIVKQNSSSNCCLKQSSRWALTSMADAPVNNLTLKNIVGTNLFQYRPWLVYNSGNFIGMSEDLNLGKMIVNADRGYAIGTHACIKVTPNTTDIECYNGFGTINLTVTGGTAPYEFLWSNGATNQNITSLTVGVYTVTVSDANGDESTISVSLTQPTPIAVSKSILLGCRSANQASISLNVSGGTSPYSYVWNTNPIRTTSSISSLQPGTYVVMVTDANGCTKRDTFVVVNPAALLLNASKTNVRCGAKPSGICTINATGGVPPYAYLWNTGSTSGSISNLPAGVYSCTVTDAAGCIKTKSITITGNPSLIVIVNPSGLNSASVNVSGGIPSYAYQWNTIPAQTNATATGLTSGKTYKVKVTDSKGCTKLAAVNMPALRLYAVDENKFDVNIFPNPSHGQVSVELNGNESYNFTVILLNLLGQETFKQSLIKEGGSTISQFDFSEKPKGVYLIKIQTPVGEKSKKLVLD